MINRKQKIFRIGDLIAIGVVFLAALTALIISLTRKGNNLVAEISLQNQIIRRIELNKENDSQFDVNGLHGVVRIKIKDKGVSVLSSSCPSQYCVHQGYINKPGQSIICAYNAVSIYLSDGGVRSSYEC